MSVRWRLTLWFSIIVLMILAVTAAVLYFQLGSYLLSEADKNLNAYASSVHGSLAPANTDGPIDFDVVHTQLPRLDGFASPNIYVQITDESGNILVRSDNLYNDAVPSTVSIRRQAMQGAAVYDIVEAIDATRLRILATPLHLQDQTLVLEVAQSLRLMDTTLARLRFVLIGGVSLAVVLVALAGGLTLTRAFQPVRRIAGIARDIEQSADLSRRVGQTGTKDEIGQLAGTFDSMISRLETVFQSQKNFIADASHELRSPLTVIRGNLDLMKKHPDKENITESLRAIESETARMSKVVEDLLLLAEIETGHEPSRDSVNLADLVKQEVARAKALAPQRQINIARSEDLSVTGDSHRLSRLLGNLLDNAFKHTPPTAAVTVSMYREGGWARLDVSDNGPGIPTEHLPHLFDRFYRVDKARSRSMGSHGLGLAIVKGIAEQQGGSVSVTSEPGKGTTFTVRLRM